VRYVIGSRSTISHGARAFLVVIASLAVLALIIPNYTKTEPDPSQAPMKAVLFASITVLFYIAFVIIQTVRHRAFFAEPSHSHSRESDALHGGSRGSSLAFHVAMLLLTLISIVLLSKSLAIIADFGIEDLGFPAPLGGVIPSRVRTNYCKARCTSFCSLFMWRSSSAPERQPLWRVGS
jgi:Ca2+:H+ antiporter